MTNDPVQMSTQWEKNHAFKEALAALFHEWRGSEHVAEVHLQRIYALDAAPYSPARALQHCKRCAVPMREVHALCMLLFEQIPHER
jgi:hypothetical protein